MKLLFIDPPRIVKKNVRTSRVKEPDLGIGYLAATAKKAGHEVAVIDAFAEAIGLDEICRRTAEFDPQVIGMPLFTFKVKEAAEIAALTKKRNSDIKVITGGAHATAIPVRTLEEFPEFDFAVSGEGEEPLLEILEKIKTGADDFSDVKGLSWRRDGKVIKNVPRPAIRDLNALPFPDWSLFPLELYFPLYTVTREFLELPISSARGCNGRCAFCFRLTRGYIRSRSAENVADEIERDFSDFGAKSVIFMDESFTAEPERTRELCAAIIRRGIHRNVHWLCETRADKVDESLLTMMKEAGCSHVSFGIESGSQRVLDANRKGITLEQAEAAIKTAKRVGLQVDAYFIFGLPYDDMESMKKTRMFPIRTDPDFANFFILVPYPGTLAMKLAEEGKANLKLLSRDWSDYGIQIGAAMELQDTPRSKLEMFQFVSYLYFYLRPRKLKSLFRIVSFKAAPVYLLNLFKGMIFKKQ